MAAQPIILPSMLTGWPFLPTVSTTASRATGIFCESWGFKTFAWHSADTTQCFVASNAEVILIAFRGTEPTEFEDIATDLNALQNKGFGGKVHGGCFDAIHLISEDVLDSVTEQRNANQSVWFTGHSLGGALAVLCASHLHENGIDVNGIYTFGQPRTGNIIFCRKYDEVFGPRTFRFVNVDDIVPNVPPKKLKLGDVGVHYRDLGTLVWVTGDGKLVMKYVHSKAAINKSHPGFEAPPSRPCPTSYMTSTHVRKAAFASRWRRCAATSGCHDKEVPMIY
jgi:hypothetical protein